MNLEAETRRFLASCKVAHIKATLLRAAQEEWPERVIEPERLTDSTSIDGMWELRFVARDVNSGKRSIGIVQYPVADE